MTLIPQRKNLKTLRATAWLVMVGFVFQLGAASCGCFEHNGWVQLLQGAGHDQREAVADADHSHSNEAHNHHFVEAKTDGESLQEQHDCKPSAISNAVVAQQVRLPSTVTMACLLHSHSDSRNRFGSGFGQATNRALFSQFRNGPARFVTQAFLL